MLSGQMEISTNQFKEDTLEKTSKIETFADTEFLLGDPLVL